MKTYTAAALHNRKPQMSAREMFVPSVAASIREILALLSAVTAATSIVLGSVWATGLEMSNVFSALVWALGFVFLGLALNNRGALAYFQFATGLVLPVLASLQNSVSPDFAMISGALLAAWVAIAIFVHLR